MDWLSLPGLSVFITSLISRTFSVWCHPGQATATFYTTLCTPHACYLASHSPLPPPSACHLHTHGLAPTCPTASHLPPILYGTRCMRARAAVWTVQLRIRRVHIAVHCVSAFLDTVWYNCILLQYISHCRTHILHTFEPAGAHLKASFCREERGGCSTWYGGLILLFLPGA